MGDVKAKLGHIKLLDTSVLIGIITDLANVRACVTVTRHPQWSRPSGTVLVVE
jgi:hypothetical protein